MIVSESNHRSSRDIGLHLDCICFNTSKRNSKHISTECMNMLSKAQCEKALKTAGYTFLYSGLNDLNHLI